MADAPGAAVAAAVAAAAAPRPLAGLGLAGPGPVALAAAAARAALGGADPAADRVAKLQQENRELAARRRENAKA